MSTIGSFKWYETIESYVLTKGKPPHLYELDIVTILFGTFNYNYITIIITTVSQNPPVSQNHKLWPKPYI